ncbi:alpha/beta hydrolase, partial [Klebsiella pneumoniae subsp. pneumoniae]|nr:alpha/beta hydrolase [Klebsiella pneumoniae subsp. pneumoniae]
MDSRNQGRSSRQSAKMTFEQMAADLEEILQFLNIKKALFVGHSDGANLAMVYASRFPDRIAGLLLNAGNMTFKGLTRRSRCLVYIKYYCLKALSLFSSKMDILAQVTELML